MWAQRPPCSEHQVAVRERSNWVCIEGWGEVKERDFGCCWKADALNWRMQQKGFFQRRYILGAGYCKSRMLLAGVMAVSHVVDLISFCLRLSPATHPCHLTCFPD